tara:strand:- start:202 stop:591 length:390 start_codon:yes stop_codon:yes gene_type:complete
MGRYVSGRFALRISDRDGMAYPYNEMVQEWTGAWVHISEYEPKSPLLNPTNHPTDAQSLKHAKPQRGDATIEVGVVGVTPNFFQTLDETTTLSDGSVVTVKSMMPLSIQQPSKITKMQSFTGNVTVSTS